MIRLAISILFAPFWVCFALAGGIAGLGVYVAHVSAESHVELQRMVNAPVPAAVPIAAFTSDKAFYLPEEVNVTAQIAVDHNVNLIKTKNGETTSERRMFILVAPDASSDAREAYGAVILDPSQMEQFASWVMVRGLLGGEEGSQGPVLQFNGLVDSPRDKSHIKSALKNQGYTAAKDFMYIAPFLEGREAAFAKELEDEPLTLSPFLKFAGVLALIGMVQFLLGRFNKGRSGKVVPKAQPVAAAPSTPFVPAPEQAAAARDNDFIGALARKAAAPVVTTAMPNKPAIVSRRSFAEGRAEKTGGGLGGLLRKAGGLAMALVLYLVAMNFSGSMGMPNVMSLMGANEPQAGMAVATSPSAEPRLTIASEAITSMAAVQKPAPVAMLRDEGNVIMLSPEPLMAKPVAATGPATGGGVAEMLAQVSAWATGAIAKVSAQLTIWQTALPLWLIAALAAGLVFLLAAFMLSYMSAGRGQKTAVDPFERLLQRRLAEKARDADRRMMCGGMQQA